MSPAGSSTTMQESDQGPDLVAARGDISVNPSSCEGESPYP